MLRQIAKGWVLGLVLTAVLHMGAVVKKRDPIYDETLTGPISLKDKMEETKDGEKGAPSPSFKYYGGKPTLAAIPIEAPKEEKTQTQNAIPNAGESIPEKLEDAESQEIGGEWWDDNPDETSEKKPAENQEEDQTEEINTEIKTDTGTAVQTETAADGTEAEKESADEWWSEGEESQIK